MKRTLLAAAAGVAGVLLSGPGALAHVTVNPREATGGSFAKLAFGVPNEKDAASTVKLVTEAVSKITWAGGAIKPGEFQEFDISVGPLPDDAGSLTFKVLQTYSDGEIVRWIEEPAADGGEVAHPAPILKLTKKADEAATTATTATPATTATTATTAEAQKGEVAADSVSKNDVESTKRIGYGGIALGLVALALALAGRGRRRA